MQVDPNKNIEVKEKDMFFNEYDLISNHIEESEEEIDYWTFWEDTDNNDD